MIYNLKIDTQIHLKFSHHIQKNMTYVYDSIGLC